MKIKLNTIHVDDQEKALRSHTDVMGFVKKTDRQPRSQTIAQVNDTCGNLIQLTQLSWQG